MRFTIAFALRFQLFIAMVQSLYTELYEGLGSGLNGDGRQLCCSSCSLSDVCI